MPDHEAPFPVRKSIRLQGFDYSSPGLYFVTICTDNKKLLFGSIQDETVQLNQLGSIVQREWLALEMRHEELVLDEYVIMPNHLHGIVGIVGINSERPARTLSAYIGEFKSLCVRHATTVLDRSKSKTWQRGFHEHIVRSERSLDGIRSYIQGNPAKWALDPDYVSGE